MKPTMKMKWKKVSPELNRFLDEAMAAFPADKRPMFGASTYFVNGNMFVGIHEDRIILRLSEPDRKEIFSLYSEVKPFEPMAGRVMKEYVTLPDSVFRQPEVLKKWLSRSYQYALSLKPKATKRDKKEKGGLSDLRVGRNVEVTGTGKKFGGKSQVERANHAIGDSGHSTTFDVRRKKDTP